MADIADERERVLRDIGFEAPHVVILGAGASRAAFPTGDRNGRPLPLMVDLVELLGLRPALREAGIADDGKGFESIYGEICGRSDLAPLKTSVQIAVRHYFSSLELPDAPTLYDYLVLSLRKKDVIATFNWDPLLWNAAQRNAQHVPGPHLIFLHGNVAVGYCETDKVKGLQGEKCLKCGQPFRPSTLLYPISNKDYTSEPSIAGEWDDLQKALRRAYLITVFGYSAPRTDAAAVDLILDARGKIEDHPLDEIEFIDLKDREELSRTWRPLIHSHHFHCCADFFDSMLAKHPRRTCEAFYGATMQLSPFVNCPLPRNVDLPRLREAVVPYLNAEATTTT